MRMYIRNGLILALFNAFVTTVPVQETLRKEFTIEVVKLVQQVRNEG
jgi:hypothetical protein